jgi:hypothetical protein
LIFRLHPLGELLVDENDDFWRVCIARATKVARRFVALFVAYFRFVALFVALFVAGP